MTMMKCEILSARVVVVRPAVAAALCAALLITNILDFPFSSQTRLDDVLASTAFYEGIAHRSHMTDSPYSSIEPTIVMLTGQHAAPPAWAVEQALDAARASPCQKRKVGISIYRCLRPCGAGQDGAGREIAVDTNASGYNGPPWVWDGIDPLDEGACDGSAACRRDCAARCVHAEPRALDAVIDTLRARSDLLRMVHVKLDDSGKLMGCKGPSCIHCSKLILDCGIGGIWLYELERVPDPSPGLSGSGVFVESVCWRYYSARGFHDATSKALGIYQVAP